MVNILCALTFTVLLLTASCSNPVQNPVQEDQIKYTCTGDTAILPWTEGEGGVGKIVDIEWGVVEGGTDRLIAIFSHGIFLPVPPFTSPRLSPLPSHPAGFRLANVTSADSGRYYMEMTRRHDGQLSSVRHETTLDVVDSILLNQTIQVHQGSLAVYNPMTSEWSVQLTCGHFLYTGHTAPFDVIWTDPNGRQLSSSSYHNGSFHLLLSWPLTPGTYTCRLPDHFSTCSHGLAPHLNGSIHVDGLVARVTMLEAQERQLLKDNLRWKNNITQALRNNTVLKERLTAAQRHQQALAASIRRYSQLMDSLQLRHNITTHTLPQLLQTIEQLEANNNNNNKTWALQNSLEQCTHRQQQLQHHHTALSHLHQMLILNHTSLTQQLNHTALRHEDQMTSLRQSLQELRHHCSSLNSSMSGVENRLLQIHVDDAKVTERVEEVERKLNDTWVTCCTGGQQAQGHQQGQADLDLRLNHVQSLLNQLSSSQAKSDVSFHVRMNNRTDDVTPAPSTPLVLSDVISNHGHAYDAVTGRFLAPYSATYMFVGSLAARSKGHHADMYLMWNEERVDFVEAFGQTNYTSGAVHAVLHLQAGDRVWLKSHSDSHYNASCTAFTGALLHMDP